MFSVCWVRKIILSLYFLESLTLSWVFVMLWGQAITNLIDFMFSCEQDHLPLSGLRTDSCETIFSRTGKKCLSWVKNWLHNTWTESMLLAQLVLVYIEEPDDNLVGPTGRGYWLTKRLRSCGNLKTRRSSFNYCNLVWVKDLRKNVLGRAIR